MKDIKLNSQAQAAVQQQAQLPWEKSETMHCSECGSTIFQESFVLKKFKKTLIEIPGEYSFPEDQIVPISVLVCSNCKKIQKDILPQQIKNIIK